MNSKPVLRSTNQKDSNPVEVGMVFLGLPSVSDCTLHHMYPIYIIKHNTLIILEGSRLRPWDAPSTSGACFEVGNQVSLE